MSRRLRLHALALSAHLLTRTCKWRISVCASDVTQHFEFGSFEPKMSPLLFTPTYFIHKKKLIYSAALCVITKYLIISFKRCVQYLCYLFVNMCYDDVMVNLL